ncbi:lysozyme inhibitor LprI family protein [Paenibacillus ihuae]|uniref:lysozyme inhibitor LprI family protein n=1 Tax=Paenibacillus ihuae TaxID=1232431 RepID=UPI0006D52F5F|nr:lysozyme inhibitor LprI family protein [Paenibacillus ihuae]
MRKAMLLTILVSGLALAGCSNNTDTKNSSTEPSQAVQETAAPASTAPATAAPDNAQPEATALPTTAPAASPAAGQLPAVSGTQQEYIAKLDAIEAGLKDLQPLYDSGVTASMREAANQEYERWDKALNEIYNELKQQLSQGEMAALKEKQLDWITYRDKTAKEASLEFEGGTMEPLEYTAVLGSVTKDRCYELVKLYMK